MNRKLFFAGLAMTCACLAQSTAPFACNLKAFTAAERADWRKQIERIVMSVSSTRELPDGYAFQIDRKRASFLDVARWIELEKKCCPFFTFELNMQSDGGAIWLNLRGRTGVKEFIALDFHPVFEQLQQKALRQPLP